MVTEFTEIYSDLKQIFLGGLEQPQTSWLIPVCEPYLYISGEGVTLEEDIFYLDFGKIPSLDVFQKKVCISNLTQQYMLLWIQKHDGNIFAQFKGDYSEVSLNRTNFQVEMTVIFSGNVLKEEKFNEIFIIVAEMNNGSKKEFILNVRIQTVLNFPYAQLNSNTHLVRNTISHDFGSFDPVDESKGVEPYRFSIKNIGREKLIMESNSPPDWLKVKIESKSQPIPVKFSSFEIKPENEVFLDFAPVGQIEFLGHHMCELELKSNDVRPDFRNIIFHFSVQQIIITPYITVDMLPIHVDVIKGGKKEFNVKLLNWGNQQGQVFQEKKVALFLKEESFLIPAIREGKPGVLRVPVVLDSTGLEAEKHQLEMNLLIQGSKQEHLMILVDVSVISIKTSPELVELEITDTLKERCVQVDFKASDNRKLSLTAIPEPELKEYLSISVNDSNSIKVMFAPGNIDWEQFILKCNGHGITVCDKNDESLFQCFIPVKFNFDKPSLELSPEAVYDIAFYDVLNNFSFAIRNIGNRVLSTKVESVAEFIQIIGSNDFEIEPGNEVTVNFTIDGFQLKESFVHATISLSTNIPGEFKKNIELGFEIKTAAGHVCPDCHQISAENGKYCPECGKNMQKAKFVSEDEVLICPKCYRQFEPIFKFCPRDGNTLIRFKGERY